MAREEKPAALDDDDLEANCKAWLRFSRHLAQAEEEVRKASRKEATARGLVDACKRRLIAHARATGESVVVMVGEQLVLVDAWPGVTSPRVTAEVRVLRTEEEA